MYMLVVYDIVDNKRRTKVAGILKDYGVRVQKSKFEIDPSSAGLRELQRRMAEVIEPLEDGVKYIPLCEGCRAKIEFIGQGFYVDPDEEFYVL